MNLHPHYKVFESEDLKENQARLRQYVKPDGIEIEDRIISGMNGAPDIEIRILKPENVQKGTPMIMDIHGGGFIRGHYNMDNHRNTYLVKNVPAIVIAANYRLAPEHVYPAALEDCLTVWKWIYDHWGEIGGDREKMGLMGQSAGGNLCAALALYIRDHGGPKISLNVLNYPTVDLGVRGSVEQMRYEAPTLRGKDLASAYKAYLGDTKGEIPSYYVLPNRALDLTELPPTFIVVAEYDPLRDEGIEFAQRLMKDTVPVELHMVSRVGHGYDLVKDAPMTQWMWMGISQAFQREFGMLENNADGEPFSENKAINEKSEEERELY